MDRRPRVTTYWNGDDILNTRTTSGESAIPL